MASDERLSAAYDFELPKELIAQSHAHPRDASRLLVMRAGRYEHARFCNLPAFLQLGDLLVLNETKVISARVFGRRPSGGKVEVVLLHPSTSARYDAGALQWFALIRPARKLSEGERIDFEQFGTATIAARHEGGVAELKFALDVPFEVFLERAGRLPLPPYIHNDSQEAQEDYQTIFARTPGSVAAPTASLHFTDAVLQGLQGRGIQIARICLDVGLGTFAPMKTARLDEHRMHAESFDIPRETVAAIALAKAQGRRVVAAGTTVVRALEGSANKHGAVHEGEDQTAIFITPGFGFNVVDAMITNFHLPQSTLLVLVSAFAGREAVLEAYAAAVRERYRFFSFGDAMLIER